MATTNPTTDDVLSEFVGSMECNLFCKCGNDNEAVRALADALRVAREREQQSAKATRSAHKALLWAADKTDRLSKYVARHSSDASILASLGGIAEHLHVSAIAARAALTPTEPTR